MSDALAALHQEGELDVVFAQADIVMEAPSGEHALDHTLAWLAENAGMH